MDRVDAEWTRRPDPESPDTQPPTQDSPLIVIFNKRAMAARALRHSGMDEALRERKLPHEIIDTATPEESRLTALEAAKAGHVVVAAGGDGTARHVADGVMSSENPKAAMGHIPLGTGNDLARALGRVGHGLERAIDALQEGRVIRIDIGQVNGHEYFLNVLGVGFDAEVARRQSSRKVKIPSYFPDSVGAILSYRPREYRVSWPGGERVGSALMTAAMNGIFEGGGVRLAPKASLEDGLLEMYWIQPISLWKFARYVWAVRWGTHQNLRMLQYWQTDRLNVESDGLLQYHLDGEYREMPKGGSLDVVLHHRGLRIVV
jgi:diacylglycerol kinase (ATP)